MSSCLTGILTGSEHLKIISVKALCRCGMLLFHSYKKLATRREGRRKEAINMGKGRTVLTYTHGWDTSQSHRQGGRPGTRCQQKAEGSDLSQTSQEIIQRCLAREQVGQHKILKVLRAHVRRQFVMVCPEEHMVHSSTSRKKELCLPQTP